MKLGQLQRAAQLELAARRGLLYFIVPLWLGSGLADWYQHRRTRIELTSGTHESALHLLMQAEAGTAALLGLFFHVNAGVLLAALGGVLAHELTALWDVTYTETKRHIAPLEQHIHSYMQMGPILTLITLAVLHWDQALSLVGLGPSKPDFRLRLKRPPFGPAYLLGLVVAASACGLVPYLEEFWRCWRAQPTVLPRD